MLLELSATMNYEVDVRLWTEKCKKRERHFFQLRCDRKMFFNHVGLNSFDFLQSLSLFNYSKRLKKNNSKKLALKFARIDYVHYKFFYSVVLICLYANFI